MVLTPCARRGQDHSYCAVADQPTFWERFFAKEPRRLSMELPRVDALLDDPVRFTPVERFFDPRRAGRVGRRRLAPTATWANPVITKRIDADRKAGAGELVEPRPMARVMAQAAGCHAKAWP